VKTAIRRNESHPVNSDQKMAQDGCVAIYKVIKKNSRQHSAISQKSDKLQATGNRQQAKQNTQSCIL
jgi:hypothetical protein